MATACVLLYPYLFLGFTALITLPLITTTITATTVATTPKRAVIKLIHRDSIHSPFYNRNDTIKDHAEHTINSSIARLIYMQAKFGRTSASDGFQANLLPSTNNFLFFMNFSIGQPPVPQLAVMDTGSSLLWVQCHPCINCSKNFGPVFNPSKSSTYAELSCSSPYCSCAPRGKCNSFKQCAYSQTYVDAPSSVGILSTEQIVLETPDEGKISIPNVVFGCSHNNGNFNDGQLTGVFGLGSERISPATKLGSQFSYCTGSIIDPLYSFNQLTLGNRAEVEGYSTPLEIIDGKYYISLEGISVGDKRLDIDQNAFRRTYQGKDGVIIDSGSAATWLAKPGFEALRGEVQSILDQWLQRFGYKPWTVCYKGKMEEDLVGFPVVAFHFAGGADLVLDTGSMFFQAQSNVFCMAVFPSNANGGDYADLSLIGMMAQQYYNVAYDIVGKKLSFQRIDCELLAE